MFLKNILIFSSLAFLPMKIFQEQKHVFLKKKVIFMTTSKEETMEGDKDV